MPSALSFLQRNNRRRESVESQEPPGGSSLIDSTTTPDSSPVKKTAFSPSSSTKSQKRDASVVSPSFSDPFAASLSPKVLTAEPLSMLRPGSSSGKRDRRGSSKVSEDGHGKAPDRHELMRRAMAEASADMMHGVESSDDEATLAGAPTPGFMASIPGTPGPATPGDRPGEGSLTFDAFQDGNDVVHAEPTAAAAAPGKMLGTPASQRPSMGSRSNSFNSDMGGDVPMTPASVAAGKGGHARYATTAADGRGRPNSLAPPSTGSREGISPSRTLNNKLSSNSLTPASPSPLASLRRLSDATCATRKGTGDSTSTKKSKAPPGIAGALAASSLTGIGVGSSAIQQNAARQQTGDYIAGSQGGVYRDPSTGTLIERSSEEAGEIEGRERKRAMRERTTSSAHSFASEASDASGLGAAANFGAAVAQQGLLAPPGAGLASPRLNGEPQLTPGGIGAIGGLSPSGAGEHVSLLDDEPWPGEMMGAQITGFAVASSKRNTDFHALFPAVPEDDYLIEDYGCALVREILIQGRFYISENHICFNANIFGWVTNVVVPFTDIVSIEKRMTAFVIPNAIQIATLHSKHTFTSFLSRDATYDLIVNIWKLSHPSVPARDAPLDLSEDESIEEPEPSSGDKEGVTPAKSSKRSKLRKKLTGGKDSGGKEAAAGADVNGADGASPSRGLSKSPRPGGKRAPHRATQCPCEKDKKHMATIPLDATYPAVPEKMYNLIFTSGFMKEFWTNNQKLLDLQMSDWSPDAKNDNMLTRSMSYIKPLTGSFGPKETKCMITDENLHVDFDEYISTLTTTRTPNVPSGGSFAVKTRTCFTWAGGNTTRIFVSCAVEWSGRSMIKGIIDKASIDGQKQYYKDLDAALRAYIKEHASEFREEGDDEEAVGAAVDAGADAAKSADTTAKADEGASASASAAEAPSGALGMITEGASMAWDMISDGAGALGDMLGGASPSMLVLGGLVAFLVLFNLWALLPGSRTARRDPSDPHRLQNASKGAISRSGAQGGGDAAEAIALAVRGVLQEYLEPRGAGGKVSKPTWTAAPDAASEVQSLLALLDEAEGRLGSLRSQLAELAQSAPPAPAQSKKKGKKEL